MRSPVEAAVRGGPSGAARDLLHVQALWGAGSEQRWRVGAISWSRVELAEPAPFLPGSRLRVVLADANGELGRALVEVVPLSGGRLGLRYVQLDDACVVALEQLLEPPTAWR